MALLDINEYLDYLAKTPYEVEKAFEEAINKLPTKYHNFLVDIIALSLILNKMSQLQRGLLYYNEHKMLVRVGFKSYPIHSLSKEVKHFAAGRLVEGYIIEEEFLINR